jgi:endonuclease/exonuclease/phosphatase family metal-dependent hydrolase
MRTAAFSPIFALLLLFFAPLCTEAQTTLRLVSQNLNRFFDDRSDGYREKVLSTREYHERIDTFINAVIQHYDSPDVLALQEVENIRVLDDLAKALRRKQQGEYRTFLIEGNDRSGIDVGYLVRSTVPVRSVKALFADATYGEDVPVFSRPPLLLEVCPDRCLTILNLHLRSMRGLASSKTGDRVAYKRRRQAEKIARWVQRWQQKRPQDHLAIVGDFNALTPSDKFVDVVGTIRGAPDNRRPQWKSDDLIDTSAHLPATERVSYIFRKRRQQLDYLLVSETLKNSIHSVKFTPIDYGLSDHAALVATIRLD